MAITQEIGFSLSLKILWRPAIIVGDRHYASMGNQPPATTQLIIWVLVVILYKKVSMG